MIKIDNLAPIKCKTLKLPVLWKCFCKCLSKINFLFFKTSVYNKQNSFSLKYPFIYLQLQSALSLRNFLHSYIQNCPLFVGLSSSRMLDLIPNFHINHYVEINPKTVEICFIVPERCKSPT